MTGLTTNEEKAEPYCSKGCPHVYQHEKTCSPPSGYDAALDPLAYGMVTDEVLLETLGDLYADFHRYGQPEGGHRGTYLEAGRRIGLAKTEILRRMAIGSDDCR